MHVFPSSLYSLFFYHQLLMRFFFLIFFSFSFFSFLCYCCHIESSHTMHILTHRKKKHIYVRNILFTYVRTIPFMCFHFFFLFMNHALYHPSLPFFAIIDKFFHFIFMYVPDGEIDKKKNIFIILNYALECVDSDCVALKAQEMPALIRDVQGRLIFFIFFWHTLFYILLSKINWWWCQQNFEAFL